MTSGPDVGLWQQSPRIVQTIIIIKKEREKTVTHSGSITRVGRGKFKRLGSTTAAFGVLTKSLARVAVEPATFWAVHWYQDASVNLAHAISRVEDPVLSAVIVIP